MGFLPGFVVWELRKKGESVVKGWQIYARNVVLRCAGCADFVVQDIPPDVVFVFLMGVLILWEMRQNGARIA